MAERIGSTPIALLALATLLLTAIRLASLVLGSTKSEAKGRRQSHKEARMSRRLIAGAVLETAWVISAGVISGFLPSLP
jgi:hypothetical protein